MKRSFICDLVPTLSGPAHNPKETVSFYADYVKDGFKIYGVSSSGVLKEGVLKFSEKSDSVLVGGFFENGVEFKVSFEIALFDTEFVMGSGIWSEFSLDGGLRQKYNSKVWDHKLSNLESRFAVGALERLEILQKDLNEVREQEKELSKNYSSLEDKVEDALSESTDFVDNKDELDAILSNFQEAEKEYDQLVVKLESRCKDFESELSKLKKENQTAEQFLKDFEEIKKRSAETQEKADKALSSSITVQLARSFKIRKDDAVAIRVHCDKWFGISIAAAICISISFVLLATCRVPDDQMSYRSYPLLAARELLQQFIREQVHGHQAA